MNIRWATIEDAAGVASVLAEAAEWLRVIKRPIWGPNDVSVDAIFPDIEQGRYLHAKVDDEIAGVVRFQLSDKVFWPDLDGDDSAFIHRLAVRRKFAGSEVSKSLIEYSAIHALKLGKKYLRLDCVRDRQALRKFYESHGFNYHSDFEIGRWAMARYEMHLQPKINMALNSEAQARQSI